MRTLIALLFVALMATNCFATISTTRILSPDDVTITNLDTNFVTLTDAANSLDGTLIQTGTITSDALDANANPVNSRKEGLGDFVYTGLLAPTSASLVSTTTAGTAYVEGWRVVKAATAKTYTASKDTYVDLSKNGVYTYSEVALGGTAPSVATSSIRLFKAVTNGTAITSVTDLRQLTPPVLRIYQDLKLGCVVSRDITTATKVSIDTGTIEFGSDATSGNRRNSSPVYIDTTTTGRNALDTGTLAAGYYAVWAYPDPDNSTNFECLASTSFAAPGTVADVDDERVIGWFYANSVTHISPDSIGAYRDKGGDAPNIMMLQGNTDLTQSSTAFTVMEGMDAKFYSSGRPVEITFTTTYNDATSSIIESTISLDSVGIANCQYDSEQAHRAPVIMKWVGKPSNGEHTIQVKWRTTNSAVYQYGTISPRVLIIEEK